MLDPELRERQRLAPAPGVVDEVLELPETELAEPDQCAVVALFEHDLDGRLAPRLAPLVDETLRPLRLDDAAGNIGVDALLGAPVDPTEQDRSAGTGVDATAAGEPAIQSLSGRERVVDLLA